MSNKFKDKEFKTQNIISILIAINKLNHSEIFDGKKCFKPLNPETFTAKQTGTKTWTLVDKTYGLTWTK